MQFAVVTLLGVGAQSACAEEVEAHSAALLSVRYQALRDRLSDNAFRRPLYLESDYSSSTVSGDILALVDYPFPMVAAALTVPAQWCEILILHLNTKYCRASTSRSGSVLHVGLGRKHFQPLDKAYRLDFAYRVDAHTPSYLKVRLAAATGPLGTRDYRIVFEAIPVEGARTFIHLNYAHTYGLAARLALQTYLATIGSGKVGFTVVDTASDGQPLHVKGLRGVVERNSVRYYLAIEAFLDALREAPPAQIEKRFRNWFDAVERYPVQLHELERNDYLEMKRREYLRQQAPISNR